MSTLNRSLAPLSDAAWQAIDHEAEGVFKVVLAGRKLVDFNGPLGWTTSAIDTGRTENVDCGPNEGVSVHLRKVQPLIEIYRELEVSRDEIEAIDRGAKDADLENVVGAARGLAIAEDNAVFNGLPSAGTMGLLSAATHAPFKIAKDYENYPAVVAKAVSSLLNSGIDGPYAIALGHRLINTQPYSQ